VPVPFFLDEAWRLRAQTIRLLLDAKDRGEYRQAAGTVGKALNCGGTIRRFIRLIQTMSWRSPQFYSNRVMLGFALLSIVIGLMAAAVR
jgi:hypothetical protein